MKFVIAFVFVTAVMYTAGVVIGKSFNPWDWQEDLRGLGASFWVLIVFFCLCTVSMLKQKDRK